MDENISVLKINDEWWTEVDSAAMKAGEPKGAYDNLLTFLFGLTGTKEKEIVTLETIKVIKYDKTWWFCMDDFCKLHPQSFLNGYLKQIKEQEVISSANN